jgi:hypothetical protein
MTLTVPLGLGCRNSDQEASSSINARRVQLPIEGFDLTQLPKLLRKEWLTAWDAVRTARNIDLGELSMKIHAAGRPRAKLALARPSGLAASRSCCGSGRSSVTQSVVFLDLVYIWCVHGPSIVKCW